MILVKLVLSALDCHCTVPVFPFNVNCFEFVPEQTDPDPLIIPATDTGFTVITMLLVVAGEQVPLETTAL
jgi:hypothetical protein